MHPVWRDVARWETVAGRRLGLLSVSHPAHPPRLNPNIGCEALVDAPQMEGIEPERMFRRLSWLRHADSAVHRIQLRYAALASCANARVVPPSGMQQCRGNAIALRAVNTPAWPVPHTSAAAVRSRRIVRIGRDGPCERVLSGPGIGHATEKGDGDSGAVAGVRIGVRIVR